MLVRDYLTDARLWRATWSLTAADPGDGDPPVEAGTWGEKSVTVEGDFGTATVVVEGGNAGRAFFPLLTLRYADHVACPVNAGYWRVRVLDADAQTALTVTLLGTRT